MKILLIALLIFSQAHGQKDTAKGYLKQWLDLRSVNTGETFICGYRYTESPGPATSGYNWICQDKRKYRKCFKKNQWPKIK